MKQGVMQGKRVLVTGGAIRVGAVLVRAFADAGAEVIVHCRTHADAAAELPASRILTCDLTEPGAPEKLISDAGHLDILINNASAYIRKPFETETQADVQAMLDINFFAPLALMKAFAMTCNPDACIINLLDQAVSGRTEPGSFGYLVSKKALADATECAALAYAPRIRVNGIAPGPVIAPPGLEHLNMEKTLKMVPLNRRVEVDDIAQTALYLATNRSITGTIVSVDGGQHLHNGGRNG